ncbi:MAG: TetR/AcrR family transcriptional regulator [Alphaproteobacteria bacterium]|nr:TetR/AcrR family transcriptional regulator [Alphaproteobacteria bacterium]
MPEAIKSKVEDPALIGKRRAQIIKAATDLFGRDGYHVTTIRDIAVKAGVSIGLIYQYVEDKEDVLYLALVDVLDSYLREIPKATEGAADPLARFRAAVLAYCRVIDALPDATVLAYRETKSLRRVRRDRIKAMETETNALIAACVRDCQVSGLFDKVDVDLFTYQIVMFCHAWALKAWHFKRRMSVDAYVVRGLDLMLNAVLTPKGAAAFRSLPREKAPRPKARKARGT